MLNDLFSLEILINENFMIFLRCLREPKAKNKDNINDSNHNAQSQLCRHSFS